MGSVIGSRGDLRLRVIRNPRTPTGFWDLLLVLLAASCWWTSPEPEARFWRLRNIPYLWRGSWRLLLARLFNVPTFAGFLYLKAILRDGRVIHFGLASTRVVTTAGVNAMADAFQGSIEPETFRYHGIGTGVTAEAIGDTALVTELTTEYTGNVRATGTLTEGATANIFRTVGSNLLDGTPGAALREHGIFTQAATGGGTLLDRTLFGAITLSSGDTLESTYDLTLTAGG